MGKKWLRGDNTVNIQGRSIVLVHSTSSHCHLSINQVSFLYLLARTGIHYDKYKVKGR